MGVEARKTLRLLLEDLDAIGDSTASGLPSNTASSVPSARLPAQPATPRVSAARATENRNPTP